MGGDKLRFAGIAVGLSVPTVAYVLHQANEVGMLAHVAASFAFALFGLGVALVGIPRMCPLFIRAKIFGYDINKRGTPGGKIQM